MPGAVTFLHEAGSALNVNPHPHSLLPDGVFVFEPEQPATFLELPAPSKRQLEAVLRTIIRRIQRVLEHGESRESAELESELEDEPLAQIQARAVQARLEPTLTRRDIEPPAPTLCARQQGFSLHAAVTVAADDKQGRLRLLRYGARPALSSRHLELLEDGRVRYQLRHSAGPAGARAITLQPTEFLHRLAATLPPPYLHRTVYHGIFSPAASRRFEVTAAACRTRKTSSGHRRVRPAAASQAAGPGQPSRSYSLRPERAAVSGLGLCSARQREPEAQAILQFAAPPPRPCSGRIPWAELIKRTFPDALDCPKCGGPLSVIAYITELAVVRKILEHLGLPTGLTELAPARRTKELGFDFQTDHHDADELQGTEPWAGATSKERAPPRSDLEL